MPSAKKQYVPVEKYKKILVGYDGSENAERALARAVRVAATTGAKLRVLVVINNTPSGYGPYTTYYPQEFVDEMFDSANKSLDEAIKEASATIKDVSGRVEEGHPAEVLLDMAKKEGVDLIVVGRRGISGFERLLLGGVSSSIVSHSECDVLVVK